MTAAQSQDEFSTHSSNARESYQTSLTSTLQQSYKIVRFAEAHKTAKLSPATQEMFDLVAAQSALNAQIVMRTDQKCATISAALYH